MVNICIVLVLLLWCVGAGYSLYKNRKRGIKCTGCPYENSCLRECGNNKHMGCD